jgi:hypothetical protein
MTKQNFTTTIEVDQTPQQVFDAINKPHQWWPGEVIGNANKLNDTFTYRYEDLHLTKQKVVELVPYQKVVWLVTESEINYADDKDEWLSTKISFEIFEQGGKTQLRFTHIGLNPQVECFESCSHSWRMIIGQSLFSLITTGEGIVLDLG